MKKRILSALLCLSLLIGLLPATVLTAVAEDAVPAYTLDNGYIRVSVSKENGGFAVSTVEGDKLKKSDNNKTLLYHNGQYDTSFLSLRIGEGEEAKDYLFGGKFAFAVILHIFSKNERNITAIFNRRAYFFNQIFISHIIIIFYR